MPWRGLNYVHPPEKKRYVHHEPQNVTHWNKKLCRGKALETGHSEFGLALNPMVSPEKRRDGKEEKRRGSRTMESWNHMGCRQRLDSAPRIAQAASGQQTQGRQERIVMRASREHRPSGT